jgi:predicted ATPase
LANRVNEALSNDLFIDNGYQVHVASSLILPRVGVDYFLKEKGRICGGDFNAKIELMDSHGRILSFDQVGSGIGYVLPVLVEALNSENAGAMVFLQQPELHLHPAMQASLSDVLIDAAADKRILVETHSEHMILRALKRVRQTFNDTLVEKSLRLTYEDVAVNYFEPQGDGTTKVHIIRVAPDGEFIDRWPHGFFAERDQELFDE